MINKNILTDTVVARESDTVLEVSRILRDTQSRHLVVLSDEHCPVGIISTVDVNNRVVAQEKDPKTTLAKDMMTRDIITIDCEDTYENALKKMAEAGTYSMPVTRECKLLGTLELRRAVAEMKNESN